MKRRKELLEAWRAERRKENEDKEKQEQEIEEQNAQRKQWSLEDDDDEEEASTKVKFNSLPNSIVAHTTKRNEKIATSTPFTPLLTL